MIDAPLERAPENKCTREASQESERGRHVQRYSRFNPVGDTSRRNLPFQFEMVRMMSGLAPTAIGGRVSLAEADPTYDRIREAVRRIIPQTTRIPSSFARA
jgi:hypothetical protein